MEALFVEYQTTQTTISSMREDLISNRINNQYDVTSELVNEEGNQKKITNQDVNQDKTWSQQPEENELNEYTVSRINGFFVRDYNTREIGELPEQQTFAHVYYDSGLHGFVNKNQLSCPELVRDCEEYDRDYRNVSDHAIL